MEYIITSKIPITPRLQQRNVLKILHMHTSLLEKIIRKTKHLATMIKTTAKTTTGVRALKTMPSTRELPETTN
jgi:hypothetical protein